MLLLLSIFPADTALNTQYSSTCVFSIVLKNMSRALYFFFWQTRLLFLQHAKLFHFPLLNPVVYMCPQFSSPGKLGSPCAHAEKPPATWVPSTHWNTLSPLPDSIPSQTNQGSFSIRLKRKSFSAADLITGRLAHNLRHSSSPWFHVDFFFMLR